MLFASFPVDTTEPAEVLGARVALLGLYVARFTRPTDITLVQAKAAALMIRAGGVYEPSTTALAEIAFTAGTAGRYTDARRVIAIGDPRFDSALLEPVARMRAEQVAIDLPRGRDTLQMRILIGLDPGGANTIAIAQLAPLTTVTKPAHILPTSIYPVWPKSMEAQRINDDVVVRILVDARGRAVPDSVKVMEGKHQEYIDAVLAVIPKYRWTPAVAGACTVQQWVQMPFMFHFAGVK